MKIIKKREGEENWKACGWEWGEEGNALPLILKQGVPIDVCSFF
jgi:hypothetical protein